MAFLILLLNLISIATAAPIVKNIKNETESMKNESRIAINRCFPDYIIPEYNNIHILPYAKFGTSSAPYISKEETEGNFIFYGKSSIDINIGSSTRNITLYSSKSKVNLLSLKVCKKLPENETQELNHTFFKDDTDYILRFSNVLEPGAYVLKTEFLANVTNDEGDFFKISYKNNKGSGRLIVGDLRAIRSRYTFPCPYESLKGNLSIFLEYYEMYMVKSNVKQSVSYTFKDGLMWTNIHNIPATATYFVAVGLSDFNVSTNLAEDVNMAYRRQLAGCIQRTWKIIENVTTYLNDQLHTDNSTKTSAVSHIILPDLPKRDIAISGVIFHRERDIIYDEAFDHPAHIMGTLRSITRNVAYGLLGNMPIWLKDGFAILLFNRMHGTMDLFIIQNQHEFLYLNNNFTMEYFLNRGLLDINLISSYPGYFRAPFTLRMLQHLITDQVFQKVIRRYLNNALNSTSDYFWTVVENTLDNSDFFMESYNLTERMNRWTQLKDYPILTVYRSTDDFISFEIDDLQNVDDWWIPVSFTAESNSKFTRTSLDKYYRVFWIHYINHNSESRIRVIPFQDSNWVIANVQQTCPYRVNYETKNWERIAMYLNSLKFKRIHVLNRAQIIDDAFHLAIQGEINFSIFWNLTAYLKRETNYASWYPMFKALEYMSSIFPLAGQNITDEVQNIKGNIKEILHRILMTMSYRENSIEGIPTKYLRQEAARWACTLSLLICRRMATFYLQEQVADPKLHKLLPWWKEWTYCQGLILASYADWLKVRNTWTKKDGNKIFEFLACSQDPIIIRFYLKSLKSEVRLPDDEAVYIFHSIIAKHAKNNKVLDDILSLFLDIKPRPISTVAAIIDIINHVYSKEQLDKVRGLVKYIDKPYNNFVDQKMKTRWSEITSQLEYLKLLSSIN